MSYTMSEDGIDLIKHFEGFRSKPYRCPAGVPTIGYGTTLGVTMSMGAITEAEAEKLLRREVEKRFLPAVLAAIAGAPDTDQTDVDAMVSLAYNIGVAAFARSSVARLHKRGDKAGAAQAFLLWDKATVKGKKVRLEGLARRRQAESSLYLEGVVAVSPDKPLALGPITQAQLDRGLEPKLESATTPRQSSDKGLVANPAAARNVGILTSTGGISWVTDQIGDYQAKADALQDKADQLQGMANKAGAQLEQAQATLAKAQAVAGKAGDMYAQAQHLHLVMWILVAVIVGAVLWSTREWIHQWARGEQG